MPAKVSFKRAKITTDMAAFEPQELTDQEAQELALKRKKRPEERLPLFTARTCQSVPVTAGLRSARVAQADVAVSPHVTHVERHPGVGSDFAPVLGTGEGTVAREIPEIEFTT